MHQLPRSLLLTASSADRLRFFVDIYGLSTPPPQTIGDWEFAGFSLESPLTSHMYKSVLEFAVEIGNCRKDKVPCMFMSKGLFLNLAKLVLSLMVLASFLEGSCFI